MQNCTPCDCLCIVIPGTGVKLRPGVKIRLGRFETETWTVCYGWQSIDGNRETLSWYLVSTSDCNRVKYLQRPDLIDIYLVEC